MTRRSSSFLMFLENATMASLGPMLRDSITSSWVLPAPGTASSLALPALHPALNQASISCMRVPLFRKKCTQGWGVLERTGLRCFQLGLF